MKALDARAAEGRRIYQPEAIAAAVERLAGEIASDHARQPLLLLGVLKGALCLIADLARALAERADGPSEIMVDYMCVERYGKAGSSGGAATLVMDGSLPARDANVVLVDAIVDRGGTLAFLHALLRERGPANLRTCVLFDKPARRELDVPIEYRGLTVEDVFAIGYGLDYKEDYRNLPYLAELREDQTV
jgi:hypoxanthine phosphoribosyltransferase